LPRSQRTIFLAGLVALAGCGVAVGVYLVTRGDTHDRPLLFGFNDNAIRAGQLTGKQDATLSAKAGANISRVVFDWRWAEQAKNHYDFAPYDAVNRSLRAKGIRPLFVLMLAPQWTWQGAHKCNQYAQDCRFPPERRFDSEWRQIASKLARRYPRAAGIEIWNEQNLTAFWQPVPDARRYTELLKEAYQAIKRVNPRMPVIGGGLNDVQSPAGGNVPIPDFIRAVYRYGGKGAMDAIGVHPYPLSATSDSLLLKSFTEVRSARERARDGRTPLWVTEIGLSTTGPADQGGGLTEEQQAQALVRLYKKLRRMRDVKAVVIHTLLDVTGSPQDLNSGYGIVRPDLKPKAAYCALGRELTGKDPCPNPLEGVPAQTTPGAPPGGAPNAPPSSP
jgi:hypothetical protein